MTHLRESYLSLPYHPINTKFKIVNKHHAHDKFSLFIIFQNSLRKKKNDSGFQNNKKGCVPTEKKRKEHGDTFSLVVLECVQFVYG
jgi:hypothetical protein